MILGISVFARGRPAVILFLSLHPSLFLSHTLSLFLSVSSLSLSLSPSLLSHIFVDSLLSFSVSNRSIDFRRLPSIRLTYLYCHFPVFIRRVFPTDREPTHASTPTSHFSYLSNNTVHVLKSNDTLTIRTYAATTPWYMPPVSSRPIESKTNAIKTTELN